jgi:putative photosynthetic complex assembly protein 2
MTSPWIASLFAIFIWWLSTGVILLAVRRADRSGRHLLTVVACLPMVFLGGWAVWASLPNATLGGVYLGFLGALSIWAWIELAFLAGVLTGPVKDDCLPGLQGKDRFFRAFGTLAYHELALTLALLALVLVSAGAPNQMGMATYLVLFLARILAKLNLFFGVPRINTEFMPAKLAHMKTYFCRGPVTYAFPISITILTVLLAVCAERLWSAGSDVTMMGYALLTALTALALLEHWLMVVPLSDAKLWRWMLPAPKTMTKEESETHGF